MKDHILCAFERGERGGISDAFLEEINSAFIKRAKLYGAKMEKFRKRGRSEWSLN